MEGVTLSTVAQDLPAQLPSACLPLPSPHLLAVSDRERPTRAHLCLRRLPLSPEEVFLMEHLLASRPRPLPTLWLLRCPPS